MTEPLIPFVSECKELQDHIEMFSCTFQDTVSMAVFSKLIVKICLRSKDPKGVLDKIISAMHKGVERGMK